MSEVKIAGLRDAGWAYEDGLFSSDEVWVGALAAVIPAWFVVEAPAAASRAPSSKQIMAWERFGSLPVRAVRDAVSAALDITSVQNAGSVRYKHLVVPQQERTSLRLVSLHVELQGTAAGEYEAIFADEELVYLGEDSGLWARIEWNEFNHPDFSQADWGTLLT